MVEEMLRRDGVSENLLEKPAFTKKYLDSELEGTGKEVLTIRLNGVERAQINRLKRSLHYGQDAKVIKAALVVLENVVLGTFGERLMGRLTDPDRRRVILEDVKDGKV